MPYEERKKLIQAIEDVRGGRTLISLCNFDRHSNPELPGLQTQFQADIKECIYRVLKESRITAGIDLFLYTRGGDTNSVWPIACLLREFDPDFEVLVPFRAHSAGTMLALAGRRIIMTKLGELSPIDPTTGNLFNPIDQISKEKRLGISVEDVRAYRDFVLCAFGIKSEYPPEEILEEKEMATLMPFLNKLSDEVHPLALGNVHRVHQLVSRLAKKLMQFHEIEGRDIEKVVKALTVETYSHLHMIGRDEAIDIIGGDQVQKAGVDLEDRLDKLLRIYEEDFHLRSPIFATRLMGSEEREKEFRFIGGALESKSWGYLFETKGKMVQHTQLPSNVTVQVPHNQSMPLIPGLAKGYNVQVVEQRWHRNTEPEGVTL